MGILSRPVSRLLPWLPRPLVARVARRYVAGTTAEEVLELVSGLEARELGTTVDILGENVRSREEGREVADDYLRLLDSLAARGVSKNISVKLTHLGLRADETFARDLAAELVRRAEELGGFVRLDMEDSTTTDATLRIFRSLRERSPAVGVAIQAYLRRSREDIEGLLPLEPNLRICKGIYREPPSIAFPDRGEIRKSFVELLRAVLEGGGFAAIATHDPWVVERAVRLLEEQGAGPDRHEFQMLLGVGHDLRPRILRRGSALRIYCPYGEDWYDYSLRRLQENPNIVGYVLRDVLRGLWSPGQEGRG